MASNETDTSSKLKNMKVLSWNRRIRKLIATKSYDDFVHKCRERFDTISATSSIKLFLNEDGMEVDEVSFDLLPSNTVIMITVNDESWSPVFSQVDVRKRHANEHGEEIEDSQVNPREKKLMAVLEDLRAKKKKLVPKPSTPQEVKLQTGWRHFSYKRNQYIPVRSSLNHQMPAGETMFPSSADHDTCIEILTSKYFKNGKSKHGKLSQMNSRLGNTNSNILPVENFSALKYYKECGQAKRKIYLMTQRKTPSVSSDSSSDELPDLLGPNSSQSSIPTSSEFDACLTTLMPVPTSNCTTPSATQCIVHADTPTVTMNLPDRKCGICTERECDAFFMPCGHTSCLVCALQIETMGQTCPNCRSQIEMVKSMFYN